MKKDMHLAMRLRGGRAGYEPVLQPPAMDYYYQMKRESINRQNPDTSLRYQQPAS